MRSSYPLRPGIKPSSASWIMTDYSRSYQVWDFYISIYFLIEMNIWTILALGAMVQCQTTSTSSSSSSSSSTSSSSSSSTSSGASTVAPVQNSSPTVFLNTSRGEYSAISEKKTRIFNKSQRLQDQRPRHKALVDSFHYHHPRTQWSMLFHICSSLSLQKFCLSKLILYSCPKNRWNPYTHIRTDWGSGNNWNKRLSNVDPPYLQAEVKS